MFSLMLGVIVCHQASKNIVGDLTPLRPTGDQEMVVRDVETFNKAELRPAETQEPMTGAELLKKELDVASLNAEVVNFDKAGLKEAEVGVKDILPNERDIKLEKEKVELIGGIENFDIDNLARV